MHVHVHVFTQKITPKFLWSSPTLCLQTQRQAVRVTLKELESLSFDIPRVDVLKQLLSDLESLKTKYRQTLSTENGLVLRTQATCTCPHERARKLKLKYKRFRQRAAPYGSLIPKQQSGRPRSDHRYRNRVGKKATDLRKVSCTNSYLLLLLCLHKAQQLSTAIVLSFSWDTEKGRSRMSNRTS